MKMFPPFVVAMTLLPAVQLCAQEKDVLWDAIAISPYIASTPTYTTPDAGSKLAHSATARWEGAVSRQRILGDGYVKFKFSSTVRRQALGFSTTNPNNDVASLPYRIETSTSGSTFTLNDPNGTIALNGGVTNAYTTATVFEIRRTGTTVTFYKGGVLAGTSSVPLTGSLYVDASQFAAGSSVDGCRMSGVGLDETQPVNWKIGTGVTMTYSGSWIVSKSGAATAWDAGTVSTRVIPKAGGISFRLGDVNKSLAVGLSTADLGVTNTTIELGLQAAGNGTIQVIESGVLQGSAVAATTADTFTIYRSNETIFYAKNGITFHQHALSGNAAINPLLADLSFFHPAAQLVDAQIMGAAADMIWRNLTVAAATYGQTYSATNIGSRLNKTGATNAWTADGVSFQTFSGDGFLQVRPEQTNKQIRVGLATTDPDLLGNFPYGFDFGTAGTYTVIEGGTAVTTAAAYTTADVFRIERVNGTIRYYKGNTLLRTAPTPSTGTLFADTAFFSAGAASALAETQIYTAPPDADEDGYPDAWEYQHFGSLAVSAQGGGVGFESDFDRDGISNLAEYQGGTSPSDYYNGALPDLRIFSGNGQFTAPGTVAPLSLVIEVRDDATLNSPVLLDAPVTYSVVSGGGLISLSQPGPYGASPLNTRSDLSLGQVKAWYQQPATPGVTSTIRATATSGASTTTKDFNLYTHYLAGNWLLNDASGTTAVDSSTITPASPGTLTGSPAITRVTGGLGVTGTWSPTDLAFKLNGTTQYVSVADATKLKFNAIGSAFSVAAWVRLPTDLDLSTTANIYPIVSKWPASGTGFELVLKGGTGNGLALRMMNNGAVVAGQEIVPATDQRATLTNGYPHYVVFTRDIGNVGRLYLDGVEVANFPGLSTALSNTAPLLLGKNSTLFFKGDLDDVKVLASTYGPSEISSVYSTFDSDTDGLPNSWELRYFGNLTKTKLDDGDLDGLNNGVEYVKGTSPISSDTDGDGLGDGFEVTYNFNPLAGGEQNLDSDGDGLTNLAEFLAGTNPLVKDTDGDGMWDKYEVDNGLNPLSASDANGDLDLDTLTNLQEHNLGTLANNPDTDSDGMGDGDEVAQSMNPVVTATLDPIGQYVKMVLFTRGN